MDYCGLNEVRPAMSDAIPGILLKAAKWYITTDIASVFCSMPTAPKRRSQFSFTWCRCPVHLGLTAAGVKTQPLYFN